MLTNHVIMPYDIYVPKTLIVKKVFKRRTAKNGGTEYLVQLKYFDDYSEQWKYFSTEDAGNLCKI